MCTEVIIMYIIAITNKWDVIPSVEISVTKIHVFVIL